MVDSTSYERTERENDPRGYRPYGGGPGPPTFPPCRGDDPIWPSVDQPRSATAASRRLQKPLGPADTAGAALKVHVCGDEQRW